MPAPNKTLHEKLRDDVLLQKIRQDGFLEVLQPDMTVLDLGGYDGKFARMCLDHGAKSAIVVDNQEWEQYEWSSFEPLPGVSYVDREIVDWDQPADLVICYNVLYHVKDPFVFLKHLRKLTRRVLVLCTSFVTRGTFGWRFYYDGLGHPNKTVWCRPTPEGLMKGLLDAGFLTAKEVGRQGDHIVVRCV